MAIYMSFANWSKQMSIDSIMHLFSLQLRMAIYICREGIPYSEEKLSKRIEIFKQTIQDVKQQENILEIKHSSVFSEKNQYYQYLIGILRLNRYIPPMQ